MSKARRWALHGALAEGRVVQWGEFTGESEKGGEADPWANSETAAVRAREQTGGATEKSNSETRALTATEPAAPLSKILQALRTTQRSPRALAAGKAARYRSAKAERQPNPPQSLRGKQPRFRCLRHKSRAWSLLPDPVKSTKGTRSTSSTELKQVVEMRGHSPTHQYDCSADDVSRYFNYCMKGLMEFLALGVLGI
ncbi:hypothetical protein NDU88_005109 [Pleurodeles waltl]|uniref:Uncharacterized protein n=1 Tax=Pleurodeles waltl TaxID=8319 RepID=A0AAV7V4X8_PLEWA|nr:hypothetical protein NDU88_005109 [Pleurodeles waltl]